MATCSERGTSSRISPRLRLIGALDRWARASVNRRIFAAGLTVGITTILVRLVAMGKELFVAKTFGTSESLDAFLMALTLPSFAITVIGGSFNTALMPTLVKALHRDGQAAANRLLGSVVVWSSLFLVAASVVLTLSVPLILPVLCNSFAADKQRLTGHLLYILCPMIVLSGVGSTWSGVLNAKDRFVLAGLRGALTPLAAVVGLLVAPPGRAIYGLAGGTVTGMALEAVVLAWGLKREGFSCLPHWSGYDSELRAVLSQYAPMAAGALLLGCTSVIDPAMAALAGPGSVAALGYGNKLVALVLGVASMGLGTAVFPHFSRMAAANDWKGLRNTLNTYTRILLVCTIPVTVVIMLFSADIVRLLFERGNFTAGDTELVGTIQCFYALQIPFYLVGILAVRLISALRANHFMMFVAALTLCQDVLCNLLLIPRLGVAGVGVSNALVYIVSCCLLVFAAHRRLRRMERAYG